uniref:Uncharacterized protein n=1 Tax=Cacopsylla melanoneura TaxID=428564 RepID=A0A8D8QLV6_9HEMI
MLTPGKMFTLVNVGREKDLSTVLFVLASKSVFIFMNSDGISLWIESSILSFVCEAFPSSVGTFDCAVSLTFSLDSLGSTSELTLTTLSSGTWFSLFISSMNLVSSLILFKLGLALSTLCALADSVVVDRLLFILSSEDFLSFDESVWYLFVLAWLFLTLVIF